MMKTQCDHPHAFLMVFAVLQAIACVDKKAKLGQLMVSPEDVRKQPHHNRHNVDFFVKATM